ncbi:hypothetical protein BC835DRAFT_674847 [Cytidiella melzeri]|nr:hypothetical protein BC835DRAFT_674847 [Cytidiella melzeri]
MALIRARSKGRTSRAPRLARNTATPMWHMMWKGELHLILVIWVTQTVLSSASWSKLDLGEYSYLAYEARSRHVRASLLAVWSSIDVACFTIIVACGGRIYQYNIRRSDQCPTLSFPCLISSAVRAVICRSKPTPEFAATAISTSRSTRSYAGFRGGRHRTHGLQER